MKKLLLISFIFVLCIPALINAQYYYNRAFNFTGATGTYAVTDPGANLSITGSFTVECWVYPVNVATPSYQILIQKRLGSAASGYTLYLSTGKVCIRTNSSSRLTGNTVIPNNAWSHVAATYNSSTNVFTVYVNGVADGTVTTASAAPAADTDSLRFAAGFNSPFAGMMDEIRIWNIELQASDIQTRMRIPLGESTGIYTGLVCAWRGNSVTAGSGAEEINGYTAWLRGAATFADLTNKVNSHLAYNTALLFTAATGTYVTIPNTTALNPTSAITLECWLNTDNTSVQCIIGKGSAGYPYRLIKSTANTFRVIVNGNVFGSGNYGGIIPTNQWVHLAFTYNSVTSAYVYYMNGIPTQSGTQSVTLVSSNDPLTIGGGPSLALLSGMVDEFRISNYAKSPDEIAKGMYTSVDTNNAPGSGNYTLAYNFEGTLAEYANGGPRGTFLGTTGLRFTQVYNNATETPAPINRYDAGNFPKGYSLKYSNLSFGASPTTITDSIYAGSLIINDVNVFVGIKHSNASDISVSLVNPAGTTTRILYPGGSTNLGMHMVTIFDDQADSSIGNTIIAPFSPRVKPTNALSVFNSQDALGWWKIVLTDILPASNDGALIGWGIQFNNQTITGFGNQSSNVPGRFYLHQNYPNPFNPVTKIKFEIPSGELVKLVIFDILGREIKTLVNSRMNPGIYEYEFDASRLSSGVYFYKMQAGEFNDVKKMLLIK